MVGLALSDDALVYNVAAELALRAFSVVDMGPGNMLPGLANDVADGGAPGANV